MEYLREARAWLRGFLGLNKLKVEGARPPSRRVMYEFEHPTVGYESGGAPFIAEVAEAMKDVSTELQKAQNTPWAQEGHLDMETQQGCFVASNGIIVRWAASPELRKYL